MGSIDVLYTINPKYIDIMLASLYSFIENSGFNNINVHIITIGFKVDDCNKIERVINNFNGVAINFYPIDNSKYIRSGLDDWRGTQISNARLFITDILKENIDKMDKILYLDADTIIVNSLLKINDYQDYGVMAVKDHSTIYYREELSSDINHYYNSGVLLINARKWLEDNYQKRIVDFIKNNNKKLYLPDQDVLNCALYSEISKLPLEYNVTPYEYIFNDIQKKMYYGNNIDFTKEEAEEAKQNAKILHCIGLFGIKPWSINNVNPFNEQYIKYLCKVNTNFAKEELDTLRKIINSQPQLFYYLLSLKKAMPKCTDKIMRKIFKQ